MRFVWVDTNNDADLAAGSRHGINGYFFDLFDPKVTQAALQSLVAKGVSVGVYMASNWPQFDGLPGPRVAEVVNARVKQIAGVSLRASFPKVQFDLEKHDPEMIAATFRRWRELRPNQDTSWTMEPFQSGWMSPEFVSAVLAARVRVVPQLYLGNMQPAAADMVLRRMLQAGFPENIISGFYDAAALPAGWDGFAFTQGRLPQ